MIFIILVITIPIIIKVIWVMCATYGHGKLDKEEKEIIRRAKYLLSKVVTSPEQLFNEMPNGIGTQFQGEWALYTCSMTSAAMANIAMLFPHHRDMAIKNIERIIDIALSTKIREYDSVSWHEDPLVSLKGNNSHMSYLSHITWMMGRFKQIGGGDKYDFLYHAICEAMHRRMLLSPSLNLETYPNENIYLPDSWWLLSRSQTIQNYITGNINLLLTNGWKEQKQNGQTRKQDYWLRFYPKIIIALPLYCP